MPKVTGYIAASGPLADRSGVVRASITEKARPSSHSPASHSESIAMVHTSATTAPAASPMTQNGLIGRHGREPPTSGSAGTASTVRWADAGAAASSNADTAATNKSRTPNVPPTNHGHERAPQ